MKQLLMRLPEESLISGLAIDEVKASLMMGEVFYTLNEPAEISLRQHKLFPSVKGNAPFIKLNDAA